MSIRDSFQNKNKNTENIVYLNNLNLIPNKWKHFKIDTFDLKLGVDRLSAPILSILPIIDIGHFKNRFADNFFFFFMQTNILLTGDIIYWWINNTGETI